MDRLEEIKARRVAISPAPWKRGDEWTSNLVSDAEGEIVVYDEGRPGEDDAEFIVHAPADIDWLVEQAELARELGALLPRLEWSGATWDGHGGPCCPVCEGFKLTPGQPPSEHYGHRSDCWLAEKLGRLPPKTAATEG